METFKFKNILSDSLGIIVKNMPLVPRSERNIESISINGRNGNLHIDNGNYLAKNYAIECIVTNKEHIDDICSLYQGTGKLILSKYPDRYFVGTIKNQIDFKKYLTLLNEFPLQFELNPIAYSINEVNETISENTNINVSGNTDVYPILTISGTGIVTINGYSVEVLESDITIDCDLMECTNNNIAKNNKVILDDFPKLSPGNNNITLGTGITSVQISYRAGWL